MQHKMLIIHPTKVNQSSYICIYVIVFFTFINITIVGTGNAK